MEARPTPLRRIGETLALATFAFTTLLAAFVVFGSSASAWSGATTIGIRVAGAPSVDAPNVPGATGDAQRDPPVTTDAGAAVAATDGLAIARPLEEPIADPPTTLTETAVATPLHVALIGDSVSQEIRPYVEANVVAGGGRFVFAGMGGTAICDFHPWIDELASGEHGSVDFAVVLFTGNVLTSCVKERVSDEAAMLAAYETDAVTAIDTFLTAGIDVVVVGSPASRDGGPRPVDALYRDIVGRYRRAGEAVSYVDLDPLLTPGGEFAAELPCVDGEPDCTEGEIVPVRALDGGHLCAGVAEDGELCHGSWRVAAAIARTVRG